MRLEIWPARYHYRSLSTVNNRKSRPQSTIKQLLVVSLCFFFEMGKQLVCAITGGSQGIGYAIAEKLLSNKCIVYNLDIKEPTATTTSFCVSDAKFLQADVSNPDDVTARLQHIYDTERKCDILVNNAGIFETVENVNRCWDDSVSSETIDSILKTNLGGVIHGTRAVSRIMKLQKSCKGAFFPKIINIASTAALGPFPDHPVYASTKAGVLHFSRIADIDLRKSHGIRVYCICPGIIDTEMGRMGGEANALAVKRLDGGVRTKPELVASAVWKLVNEEEILHDSYMVVDNHKIHTVPY